MQSIIQSHNITLIPSYFPTVNLTSNHTNNIENIDGTRLGAVITIILLCIIGVFIVIYIIIQFKTLTAYGIIFTKKLSRHKISDESTSIIRNSNSENEKSLHIMV